MWWCLNRQLVMIYMQLVVGLVALLPAFTLALTWPFKTNCPPLQLLCGLEATVKNTQTTTAHNGNILIPKLMKRKSTENVSSTFDSLALRKQSKSDGVNLLNLTILDGKEESVALLPAERLTVSSQHNSQDGNVGSEGRSSRTGELKDHPLGFGQWQGTSINTTEDADHKSASIKDASNYIENIYLWTRYYNSAVGYEVLDLDYIETLASSHFVVSSPTIILVHGFLSNGLNDWILDIKDKLIAMVDCNVISVHWSAGTSSVQYYTVTGRVPLVGKGIARLVGQMHVLKQVRPDQVYIVGHSLGAHVAGFVGKRNTLEPIGRITGLDPAGLTYDNTDSGVRLDKRDAIYVDIIHTNGCNNNNKWLDCFGICNSIGHTDFWPNGGKYQPACTSVRRRERRRGWRDPRTDAFVGCDHQMAYKYYIESLDYSDSTTLFLARPMAAYAGAEKLNLSCGHFPQYMGYHADLLYGGGDYSLVTGARLPYAQPDNSCPSRHSTPRLATMTRWIIGVAATGLCAGLLVGLLATLLSKTRAVDADADQPILPGEGEQEGGHENDQEDGQGGHQEEGGERLLAPTLGIGTQ